MKVFERVSEEMSEDRFRKILEKTGGEFLKIIFGVIPERISENNSMEISAGIL